MNTIDISRFSESTKKTETKLNKEKVSVICNGRNTSINLIVITSKLKGLAFCRTVGRQFRNENHKPGSGLQMHQLTKSNEGNAYRN